MDKTHALNAFSALSQEGRLDVFRLLVRAGPEGLAAGAIAEAVGRAPNTLSVQLNLLSQAGLIESRREGRSIIYSASFDRVSDLIVYLMEDCCAGEACVVTSVQAAAERTLYCSPGCAPEKEILS